MREELEPERIEIERIIGELKNNSIYNNLDTKKKIKVEKGYWRYDDRNKLSWNNIAVSAGFSKRLSEIIYRYLSGFTHSSSLAVDQIREAKDEETQKSLAKTNLFWVMLTMVKMVKSYQKIFPKTEIVFNTDSESKTLVDFYCDVASEMNIDKDIDWDNYPKKS